MDISSRIILEFQNTSKPVGPAPTVPETPRPQSVRRLPPPSPEQTPEDHQPSDEEEDDEDEEYNNNDFSASQIEG